VKGWDHQRRRISTKIVDQVLLAEFRTRYVHKMAGGDNYFAVDSIVSTAVIIYITYQAFKIL
jgi:hypothetical protein